MKENVTRIRVMQPYQPSNQTWCTSVSEIISGTIPYRGIYISELTSIRYEAMQARYLKGGSASRRRPKPLEIERQNKILMNFRPSDPSDKLSDGEVLLLVEIIEPALQEEPLPELTEEEKLIIAESFAMRQAKEKGG